MGAYEPTQAAKYSNFCQDVFEDFINKQYRPVRRLPQFGSNIEN